MKHQPLRGIVWCWHCDGVGDAKLDCDETNDYSIAHIRCQYCGAILDTGIWKEIQAKALYFARENRGPGVDTFRWMVLPEGVFHEPQDIEVKGQLDSDE